MCNEFGPQILATIVKALPLQYKKKVNKAEVILLGSVSVTLQGYKLTEVSFSSFPILLFRAFCNSSKCVPPDDIGGFDTGSAEFCSGSRCNR